MTVTSLAMSSLLNLFFCEHEPSLYSSSGIDRRALELTENELRAKEDFNTHLFEMYLGTLPSGLVSSSYYFTVNASAPV